MNHLPTDMSLTARERPTTVLRL